MLPWINKVKISKFAPAEVFKFKLALWTRFVLTLSNRGLLRDQVDFPSQEIARYCENT